MFKTLPAVTAVAALAVAGAASAHAHLVSSTPAANAVGGSPDTIVLRFNEALEPQFSSFQVKGPAPVAGAMLSLPGQDKSLSMALTAPLKPGRYDVTWRVVSKDGHRTQGGYAFTVK